MTPGLWSVLIQAVGSAATLAAAAFVAWRFGLAAQGEFGLLRSWSDALVAIAAMGLPQGLLHLQYHEGATAATLRPFIRRHVAVVALLAAIAVGVVSLAPLSEAAAAHRVQVGIVVAAVPLGVAHLLYRALVLKVGGVVRYSVVTGVPSVLVLLGVLALGAAGTTSGFAVVIALGAAVGFAISATWSSSTAASTAPPPSWPRRVLWAVSLQTWLQAALAALLIALLLSVARALGASLREVGALSLGLYVYQLFAVLAAYAAPVIYDRVAGPASSLARAALFARWRRRVIAGAVLAMLSAIVAPRALAAVSPTIGEHATSITCFALAGLSALATRVGATVLQAAGRLRELSVQAAWRLAGALALLAALMALLPASLAAPLALLGVELATAVRVVAVLRRQPAPAALAAKEGAA